MRKNRPKYSGSPNLNMSYTKSGNSISSIPEEPYPADITSNIIPASHSVSVTQIDIRPSLLKVIFRSLANMEKTKDILENCSICYSSMTLKRLKILNCKHLIHYKCCKDWIMEGCDKCPVCSVDIKA